MEKSLIASKLSKTLMKTFIIIIHYWVYVTEIKYIFTYKCCLRGVIFFKHCNSRSAERAIPEENSEDLIYSDREWCTLVILFISEVLNGFIFI